jgi:hypothetical protein
MRQLARTHRDSSNSPDRADPGLVEAIATFDRLGMHSGEIRVYGEARLRMRFETLQLRMAGVAARLAAEYCSGQQRLSPKRNESLRIQILRM